MEDTSSQKRKGSVGSTCTDECVLIYNAMQEASSEDISLSPKSSSFGSDSSRNENNSGRISQEAKSSTSTSHSGEDKRGSKSDESSNSKRSHSRGMLCNLIRCRRVDTNDSAVVMSSSQSRNRSRPFYDVCSGSSAVGVKNSAKPLNGPNCSQCGTRFKPEKLHAHMKFCKGIKKHVSPAPKNISASSTTKQHSNQYLLSPSC